MVNSYDPCYLPYLLLIKTTLAPQSEALSAEVVVLNEVRHHFMYDVLWTKKNTYSAKTVFSDTIVYQVIVWRL